MIVVKRVCGLTRIIGCQTNEIREHSDFPTLGLTPRDPPSQCGGLARYPKSAAIGRPRSVIGTGRSPE